MTAVTLSRHTSASPHRSRATMTGVGPCLRLAWRRSRLFWTLWVLALVTLIPATVAKFHDLVPDGAAGSAALAQLGSNPTMRAMLGQPYDLTTPGGFSFWRVGQFTAVAAGLMAGLGVIRATRAEEEDGCDELIRAGVVGRHAPLAAGVALSLLGCFAVGAITTPTLLALGLPLAGSLAAGMSLFTTGAMFVGAGAVGAQALTTARSARSWVLGAALGGLYVLRAVVDASGDHRPAQWLMPLDWSALARPFAGERWWVYVLPAIVTTLLVALAFIMESSRDHGSGLVAARLGPAHARPGLHDAGALARRLQRGGMWGWSAGLLLGALAMGSLSRQMDSITDSNPNVAAMLRTMGGPGALRDSFYQAMISILVALVGLMAIVMLQRLRAEESHGRAELMLATSTSRIRCAWSHLSIAAILPSLVLLATGPALALVEYGKSRNPDIIITLFKATACMWPGLILVIGLAMLLEGWTPRLFGVVWAVLGWTVFVSWIGALLNLPGWAVQLQPWGRLPHLPTEPVSWPWMVGEVIVGTTLLTLGLVGYARRDIAA